MGKWRSWPDSVSESTPNSTLASQITTSSTSGRVKITGWAFFTGLRQNTIPMHADHLKKEIRMTWKFMLNVSILKSDCEAENYFCSPPRIRPTRVAANSMPKYFRPEVKEYSRTLIRLAKLDSRHLISPGDQTKPFPNCSFGTMIVHEVNMPC